MVLIAFVKLDCCTADLFSVFAQCFFFLKSAIFSHRLVVFPMLLVNYVELKIYKYEGHFVYKFRVNGSFAHQKSYYKLCGSGYCFFDGSFWGFNWDGPVK